MQQDLIDGMRYPFSLSANKKFSSAYRTDHRIASILFHESKFFPPHL